jgi:hypothetical protein
MEDCCTAAFEEEQSEVDRLDLAHSCIEEEHESRGCSSHQQPSMGHVQPDQLEDGY